MFVNRCLSQRVISANLGQRCSGSDINFDVSCGWLLQNRFYSLASHDNPFPKLFRRIRSSFYRELPITM